MERMTAAGRLGPPIKLLYGIPKVSDLIKRSNARTGLVGLEYIVELVGGTRNASIVHGYECALCGMNIASAGAVMHHVLQNLHKVQYLQKHFPATLAPLRPLLQFSSTRVTFRSMECRQALRHICQRIEDRFGRQLPTIVRFDSWQRNRAELQQLIDELDHFAEDVPVPLSGFPGAENLQRQLQTLDNGGFIAGNGRFIGGGGGGGGDEAELNFMPDEEVQDAYYQEEYMDDGRHVRTDWVTPEVAAKYGADVDEVPAMQALTKTVSNNYHHSNMEPLRPKEHAKPALSSSRHSSNGDAKSNSNSIISDTPAAAAAVAPISAKTYAEYVKRCAAASAELQAELQRFETAPDEHPLYPTEWRQFWQRRSAELRDEGVDVDAYDFSADWTRFWLVRVHELNANDEKRLQRRIRRELLLPLDGEIVAPRGAAAKKERWDRPAEVTTAKGAVDATKAKADGVTRSRSGDRDREHRKQRSDEKSATTASAGSSSSKPSTASDASKKVSSGDHRKRDEPPPSSSSSKSSRTERDRSPLDRKPSSQSTSSKQPPSTKESTSSSSSSNRAPQKSSTTSSTSHSNSKPSQPKSTSPVEAVITEANLLADLEPVTETVTVISVLRLLSAFEDLLGSSLGPRVVDLLSKAVALEKVKANLADELLMSSDNSVLLDTVGEKLKGLLLAGCVEAPKVRAVRKVIAHVMCITRIIDAQTKQREEQSMTEARLNLERLREQERLAEEQRRLREAEQRRRVDAESRQLVMKQLATSITLQGKQITKEQLEALTDVYIKNRAADDTPYLFGLQMGSRFPDLKEEGDGKQMQAQQATQQQHPTQQQQPQQMQGSGQVDQHPMHWNAHHQPQSAGNPFRKEPNGDGGYNNGGGVANPQQQQQQQQQNPHQGQQYDGHQQQQYGGYNQGYNNQQGYTNEQMPQQMPPHAMQQHQQHAGNPQHQYGYGNVQPQSQPQPMMPMATSSYQQQLQLQQQQQQQQHLQLQQQQQQQQQRQQQQQQKSQHKSSTSSSSSSRSSRHGGSGGGGRSSYY